MFDNDLKLTKPSDDDLADIALDPGCRRLRAAWVTIKVTP